MLVAPLLLAVAIAIEITSTSLLPKTQGFRDPLWTCAVLAGYALSIWLVAVVVRTLPVSVVYAVWSGVGTAVVALVGYYFLHESFNWVKVVSIALIVVGVVGLNLAHG